MEMVDVAPAIIDERDFINQMFSLISSQDCDDPLRLVQGFPSNDLYGTHSTKNHIAFRFSPEKQNKLELIYDGMSLNQSLL